MTSIAPPPSASSTRRWTASTLAERGSWRRDVPAAVADEFLALVDYKGSGLVVKLPAARVAELIEAGVGQPFAPAKKVFKEWLAVPAPDRRRWHGLLREGVTFARSAARR